VRFVRARVPPERAIYVATRRSDLVTAGDALFYVLASRPNATRYDVQAPGVVTTAPVQREIIGDLERVRVPVVVRWTSPVTAAAACRSARTRPRCGRGRRAGHGQGRRPRRSRCARAGRGGRRSGRRARASPLPRAPTIRPDAAA